MKFQTIKTSIISILEAGSSGAFHVVGGQRQSKGASEDLSVPRVTVFYDSGEFPKSAGSINVTKIHEPTFRIEITAIKQAEVDLSVLNNPASTAVQIAAALAAMPDLSKESDDAWDDAFSAVYNILMSASNRDLGLAIGEVSNRWIDSVKKDNPLPRGQFMVLTGSCNLTCRTEEIVTGDSVTAGGDHDTTLNIKDDPNDNAGASGNLGG